MARVIVLDESSSIALTLVTPRVMSDNLIDPN
jgi:hypothetical protein